MDNQRTKLLDNFIAGFAIGAISSIVLLILFTL